jgi:hypothetical protein
MGGYLTTLRHNRRFPSHFARGQRKHVSRESKCHDTKN